MIIQAVFQTKFQTMIQAILSDHSYSDFSNHSYSDNYSSHHFSNYFSDGDIKISGRSHVELDHCGNDCHSDLNKFKNPEDLIESGTDLSDFILYDSEVIYASRVKINLMQLKLLIHQETPSSY